MGTRWFGRCLPAEAIEGTEQHDLEPSLGRVAHELVACRSVGALFAAALKIDVLLDDLKVVLLAVGAECGELVVGDLLAIVSQDACVDGGLHALSIPINKRFSNHISDGFGGRPEGDSSRSSHDPFFRTPFVGGFALSLAGTPWLRGVRSVRFPRLMVGVFGDCFKMCEPNLLAAR